MNEQKTVLLGVSGGIAAYKAAEIVRGLQKRGVRVKVVMTEHATHFVNPLTFRSLTGEPVGLGLFDNPEDPIHHISLAQEADLFLIAPCTANVMAKLANGIADDLLSTTALATTAPMFVAPAMNVHMFENQATQKNMATLASRGVQFLDAKSGYLACGDVGKGRMAEPDAIVEVVCEALGETGDGPALQNSQAGEISDVPELEQERVRSSSAQDLAGKRIMITAGPTQEPIDPVRYISNRSSGKFGYAIAKAAAARGAEVTLISGPVALAAPEGVNVVYIETANELLEASRAAFETADFAIFAAAVADMRPSEMCNAKMKKATDAEALSHIELVENPDVLATLAATKKGQVVVGFAAETNDLIQHARTKLDSKSADMIVANEVGTDKAFGKDENEVWFVTAVGEEHVGPLPKTQLADVVLDQTLKLA